MEHARLLQWRLNCNCNPVSFVAFSCPPGRMAKSSLLDRDSVECRYLTVIDRSKILAVAINLCM
jgi:hypothetical protein